MKRFSFNLIALIIAFFAMSQNASAQLWCNKPNPNFCPGNFFQNGDFETITGNPNAAYDQDINLATGWLQIWQSGSFADLFCNPTTGVGAIGIPPTPNTNVYAGMWIENMAGTTANATYREGMYNRLATPITQNSGSYSINFRIANGQVPGTFPANPIRIGIYGVYNPGNIIAGNPINNHLPANTDLWLPNLTVKVVLLGTVTPPNNFSNTWWTPPPIVFNSNMLPSSGITHIMVTADDMFRPATTGKLYVNFDEFCIRRADPKKFCCPGVTGNNLIINGDFEGGNAGFTSGYIFEPNLTTGSVTPGKYNIVNGTGATNLNPLWVAQDPSTCQNSNGMFLMVNGSSGSALTWKSVWRSPTLAVKDWGKYKFCFKAKSFKVPPAAAASVRIKIIFSGFTGVNSPIIKTISISSGACIWQVINESVDIWGSVSNPFIEILLDESVNGANDLALDDIALIEVPPCQISDCYFTTATSNLGPTYYNITATASTTGVCTATWWEVCEVNTSLVCLAGTQVSSSSATNWWTTTMTFNDYNQSLLPPAAAGSPGRFEIGKIYKITRGTWGDCYGWNAFSLIIGYSRAAKTVKSFPEEEVKKNKKLLDQILK